MLQAKAVSVSLACDKAREHGYPHESWTDAGGWARHARERGPAAGYDRLADTWRRARGVQYSRPGRTSSRAQGGATIWNAATLRPSRRWRRFCVSIARSKS